MRISEVDAKGRSRNVSDGLSGSTRPRPRTSCGCELDAIAHRFAAGHRIRLQVAGGSLPRWDRNLGTGADPATSDASAPSHRTIGLAGGASRLRLPVTG